MGAQFYINSYKALRHKSTNMDVLVMLGTTAAWVYGVALIAKGFEADQIYNKNYMM